MPELPEVETTRKAIAQVLATRPIRQVVLRRSNLRWAIPAELPITLAGASVLRCERRGKYLLLFCQTLQSSPVASGWLLIHLGMSGKLCEVAPYTPVTLHDHVDFDCGDVILRYNDPRRFGAILWLFGSIDALPNSPLLDSLGLEPFSSDCTADYLYQVSRKRSLPIKTWLLAGKAIVGVGNIYCSESLFLAKIHPALPTGSLNPKQCEVLLVAIKQVLNAALAAGGTTLSDFASGAHSLGQYQHQLAVYGRAGLACGRCKALIRLWLRDGKAVGGRTTYYCPSCQPENF